MDPNKFRLIFFGSDRFSIRILDHLLKKKVCRNVEIVASSPTSLISEYSKSNKLVSHNWPLIDPPNDNHEEKIGLVASFGHLIDVETVNRFGLGLFNVHPSLLPQYRGSTPVQRAILDGIPETGCTIMRIPPVAKFDIGDIVIQERLRIRDREYAVELMERLADLGAILSEQLLLNYNQCTKNIRPQQGEVSSYARKLKPHMGLLQFRTESSDVIDRKIRAYTGFIDLYTYYSHISYLKVRLKGLTNPIEINNLNLDELHSRLMRKKTNGKPIDSTTPPPGTIYFHKPRQVLCIKCADGKWLGFTVATPEFKPQMSSLDFYNGYLSVLNVEDLVTSV